jgi:hypothetical protein
MKRERAASLWILLTSTATVRLRLLSLQLLSMDYISILFMLSSVPGLQVI